ncbi:MAG: hypothetical protein Q4A23_00060 [bacterium]|nr:hypothetical protein [bacterium]
MDEYKPDGKSGLGIQIDKIGYGRWAFGLNIAYAKFHHTSSELYLHIYLGKYQVSIGKMHKDM